MSQTVKNLSSPQCREILPSPNPAPATATRSARVSHLPTASKKFSANGTFAVLALFALAVATSLTTSTASAVTAASLTLKFYNTNGTALTFAQVQALQKGSMSGAYEADAFLDPATLRLISATPMTSAGALTFNLPPGQPAAFAINWPTAKGYGLVIVDNGGNGFATTATVNFTYQAAKDIKRRLDDALATRADYVWSAAFSAPYLAASNCIFTADTSAVDSVKGAQGQLALEQLIVAYDILLKEYGPIYARAHKATTAPWLGFTMEDVSNYQADLNKLATMAGPYAWVRIVFQPADAISTYSAAINYAKSKGIKVLAEPVDSQADTGYTRAQYLQRFKDCIAAYPTVDAWEVGNEVNGGWSSADVGSRIADVAAYCKTQNKKTYLTLFWQINTADTTFAMFNWVNANLPATVRSNIDYVGLSQYQEQAPLGAAFDQVMRRVQAEFPSQQFGIGELGYWISGQQYWWAYNTNAPPAKETVLDQYYKSSLGYAGANGGCFWWNFASSGAAYDFTPAMTNTVTTLKTFLSASVASTPATLTISRTNGLLKIAWPSSVTSAVLEKISSLAVGTNTWTQIATNQYQSNATETYFTASPAGNAFYRLRQP